MPVMVRRISVVQAACLMMAICFLSPAGAVVTEASSADAGGADVDQAMLDWMEAHGLKHNIVIKNPHGERGVYAATDIESGDLIARIPVNLTVMFNTSLDPDNYGWLSMSASLALEAKNGQSFYQPYYRALPMLQSHLHTLHYIRFPQEYMPLLKSKRMEEIINEAQQDLQYYWEQHGEELREKGVTIEDLTAACITIFTRMLTIDAYGKEQVVLFPLLDFGNHYNNCTTEVEYLPCDQYDDDDDEEDDSALGDKEKDAPPLHDLCAFWTAGANIKKGGEVCFRYEIAGPDQALLEYGFLLPDDPPGMSRLDAAEFAWGEKPESKVGGKLSVMKKELKRLGKRIKVVQGVAKQEAAMKAAPTDPGGVVLEGLKRLRQQRLSALRNEVERLKESIKGKEAAVEGTEGFLYGEGSDKDEL